MTENTYKIGETAELLNLKSYVLRFWETEFPQLAPLRTEKGQRLYTEADLALLKRIKHLLHDRGMTIEGARKILAGEGGRGALPWSGPEGMRQGFLPVGDLELFDPDSFAQGADSLEPFEERFCEPEDEGYPEESMGYAAEYAKLDWLTGRDTAPRQEALFLGLPQASAALPLQAEVPVKAQACGAVALRYAVAELKEIRRLLKEVLA